MKKIMFVVVALLGLSICTDSFANSEEKRLEKKLKIFRKQKEYLAAKLELSKRPKLMDVFTDAITPALVSLAAGIVGAAIGASMGSQVNTEAALAGATIGAQAGNLAACGYVVLRFVSKNKKFRDLENQERQVLAEIAL